MNTKLLIEAFQIIDGIPKKWFDLDELVAVNEATCNLPAPSTGEPIHCGTVGCALGWLSLHPAFSKKTGLQWDERVEELTLHGITVSYTQAGTAIFDMSLYEATMLFQPSCDDERSGYNEATNSYSRHLISDKKIWKNRCKVLLKEHGAL